MKQLQMKRHEQGLTLVELMIGVTLSILLLAGAISIFLGSKQTFQLQEDLARVQENVRYAVTRMITDISPAGFQGCFPSAQANNSTITSTVSGGGSLNDFANVVVGADGVGPNGSDRVTVHFSKPGSGIPVTASMGNQTANVVVDPNHPNYASLAQGSIVAVSDCSALAVFLITNDPTTSGGQLAHAVTSVGGLSNNAAGIRHVFGGTNYASAIVYEMDAVTYDLGTVTSGGKTVSNLYVTRVGGARQPLLAGVEDFQVFYGMDDSSPPDGTADRFVNWNAVAAATQQNLITSVRIRMTINPGEPLAGATGRDPDFTRDVEFTVKLRNRLGDL